MWPLFFQVTKLRGVGAGAVWRHIRLLRHYPGSTFYTFIHRCDRYFHISGTKSDFLEILLLFSQQLCSKTKGQGNTVRSLTCFHLGDFNAYLFTHNFATYVSILSACLSRRGKVNSISLYMMMSVGATPFSYLFALGLCAHCTDTWMVGGGVSL